MRAATKTLMRWTGAGERTAKAWLAGISGLSGGHLISLLRRQAEEEGQPSPNHKRVWRVMKAHGLLLARRAGGAERRHDGRVAIPERNTRWCSDGFEIACDNGERGPHTMRQAGPAASSIAAATSPASAAISAPSTRSSMWPNVWRRRRPALSISSSVGVPCMA